MANTLDSIIDYLADAVVKDANGDAEVNDLKLKLDTTAQTGTTDGDLYAAIQALGWDSDVIDGASDVIAKKVMTKVAEKINRVSEPHILWTGGHYMGSDQTFTLSETISSQPHGVVFVWSAYMNGSAQDYDWHYHFVPKYHGINQSGNGVNFTLTTSNRLGNKYLYVGNSYITGHSTNTSDYKQSASGATVSNTYWVLRAVIGV